MASILSIVSSTYKGVEYLISKELTIVEKLLEMLKQQDDGSVTQRFCLAALQKMSINEQVIELLV